MTSQMTETDLRRLGAGRWHVPILAYLQTEQGGRFAAMLAQHGIARDSLTRTLAQLTDMGWVRRNAGHGHSLRPKYVLTPTGQAAASTSVRMMRVRQKLGLVPADLPRWSLPILMASHGEWTRFSALLADLAPVTPRALSQNLKQMFGTQIILRRLEDGFPPSSLYGLTPSGHELADTLQE